MDEIFEIVDETLNFEDEVLEIKDTNIDKTLKKSVLEKYGEN